MRLSTSLCLCITLTLGRIASQAALPTLYEYYTSGGISTGLDATTDQFHLNGRPFVIFGGSLHYFRIVPQQWRRTLVQYRAAGLNTVQFYVPWNLHEDTPEKYDFESPGQNLTHFLAEIQHADLFAIIRIGPYICAEWDLGGLPSWLLRSPWIKVRTMDPAYLEPALRFYTKVLSLIERFQFKRGGPIIALQFENEYYSAPIQHSVPYMQTLQRLVLKAKFDELLFTSDPVEFAKQVPNRALTNVLETANLNENAYVELEALRANQTNRPVYVSEFWPGWFDTWSHPHHKYGLDKFKRELFDILFRVNGSVNFYMFRGGTNFAFYNGARVVTSYDYDAPLTEAGNYTDKYVMTQALYELLVETKRHPRVALPKPPTVPHANAYGVLEMQHQLSLDHLITLGLALEFAHSVPQTMELLDYPGSQGKFGQRFGFILYRYQVNKPFEKLEITGHISDRLIIMIDSQVVSEVTDGAPWFSMTLSPAWFVNSTRNNYTIDFLVENRGRLNWGSEADFASQRKGIAGSILFDGNAPHSLCIYPLDFQREFMAKLDRARSWKPWKLHYGPQLLRAQLNLNTEPEDTYLRMSRWTAGNLFVNGFNLGRYNSKGPQQTLYLPGALLRKGLNSIILFELGLGGQTIHSIDYPIIDYADFKFN